MRVVAEFSKNGRNSFIAFVSVFLESGTHFKFPVHYPNYDGKNGAVENNIAVWKMCELGYGPHTMENYNKAFKAATTAFETEDYDDLV